MKSTILELHCTLDSSQSPCVKVKLPSIDNWQLNLESLRKRIPAKFQYLQTLNESHWTLSVKDTTIDKYDFTALQKAISAVDASPVKVNIINTRIDQDKSVPAQPVKFVIHPTDSSSPISWTPTQPMTDNDEYWQRNYHQLLTHIQQHLTVNTTDSDHQLVDQDECEIINGLDLSALYKSSNGAQVIELRLISTADSSDIDTVTDAIIDDMEIKEIDELRQGLSDNASAMGSQLNAVPILTDLPLTIIFLTGNKGKLREVGEFLGDEVKRYMVNYDMDLDEIQATEEEIAAHKLYEAQKEILKQIEAANGAAYHGKDIYVVVEDTSLALNQYSKRSFNFPGPFCKFVLKANGCQGFIDMAKGHEDKSCTAICTFGVLKVKSAGRRNLAEKHKPVFFRGECKGSVTEKERGDDGFGWDSIFECAANKKTYAEMSTEEKNEVSHRYAALLKLRPYLQEIVVSKQ